MLTETAELYTAAAVAELDRIAISHGIPSFTLMRRAGDALFDLLRTQYPEACHILVVCGAGNNAGDGYVLARLCRQHGLQVTLASVTDISHLKGSAATARDQWLEIGDVIATGDLQLDRHDVIIDAMLGIGLDRDVEGEWLRCVEFINASTAPVIAVDIPSGLDADTGRVRGQAVFAAHTLSFIAHKQGLYTADARAHCGRCHLDDLNVPAIVFDAVPASARLIQQQDAWLPARAHNSHKSDFGHVLIIGGDHGMAGAVALAARAALRIGAGMVSVLTQPEHVSLVTALCPEAMVRGSDSGDLPDMPLESVSHVLAGCGLGQGPWSQRLLHHVRQMQQPVIYDADALNLIANDRLFVENAAVMTPHPGEAARLLDSSVTRVQSDRFGCARELSAKFGCRIVLKGSGTLVSDSAGIQVCAAGSAAMATAGMGDVLAGFVVGLIAQGLQQTPACAAAVLLHADAAELAARGKSRGILASDVIDTVTEVMHEY